MSSSSVASTPSRLSGLSQAGNRSRTSCKNRISAIVLVKNSQRYIRQCLEPLSVLDEVLVIDTGSEDDTLAIARKFENVRVAALPLEGFGALRNQAAELARNDWILVIDSDEIASPELIETLMEAPLDQKSIYRISIRNHYRGRWLKTCGWSPCLRKRLYHRQVTSFGEHTIHESLEIPPETQVVSIAGHLDHYSIDSLSEAIAKMQAYSDLYVRQHAGRKRASFWSAIAHGLAAFLRCYLLRGGFRSGHDGLVISLTTAMGSYCKYAKLYEANQSREMEHRCKSR